MKRSPSFTNIVHPTDFSLASEGAFVHALKLAVEQKASLRIVHFVGQGVMGSWEFFPKVRETLCRWGVLELESTTEEIASLGLSAEGVLATGPDLMTSILRNVGQDSTDLLVLATQQLDGIRRWLHKPVAEPLARRAGISALFVPPASEGFVSPEDGTTRLKRVLIPINHDPKPQPAVDVGVDWAETLGGQGVEFRILHIGSEPMPAVKIPTSGEWKWKTVVNSGSPVEGIIQEASQFSPHLLIMVTQGHKGVLDMLRGDTTEQVLRGIHCPLLAIPAH